MAIYLGTATETSARVRNAFFARARRQRRQLPGDGRAIGISHGRCPCTRRCRPEIHRPTPVAPPEQTSTQKRNTQKTAVENKLTKVVRNPVFAVAIFFVGLSSLGAVLYLNFRTPPRVEITGALGDLPVASAWRQGDQVSIQLKDNDWFSQHRRDQKKALKSALSNPKLDGSEAYLVRDTSGNVRTQAFWHIPKGKSVRKLTVSTR